MRRILAAVDLSDSTEKVLQFSADLARVENASVAVLYAIPAATPVTSLASSWGMSAAVVQKSETSDLQSALRQLREVVEANGLSGADCFCMRGSSVETIRDAAKQIDADLIVTGTHCHGRFFHAVFGSVHEELLAQAPCPVLIVPNHAHPS